MATAYDRVLRLSFRRGLSDPDKVQLFCEVQGSNANVIAAEPDGTIVLAARQIGSSHSRVRTLRVGAPYQPPPAPPGTAPDTLQQFETWQAVMQHAAQTAHAGAQQSTQQVLVTATQGVSPALAGQLCLQASIEASSPWHSTGAEQRKQLHAALLRWLHMLKHDSWRITRDPTTGALSAIGAYREEVDSVHAVVDDRYRRTQSVQHHTELHSRLVNAVQKALRHQQGRIAACEKQLEGAADADKTQKLGDLAMANVYRWPAGAAELAVEDWDTGAQRPSSDRRFLLHDPPVHVWLDCL